MPINKIILSKLKRNQIFDRVLSFVDMGITDADAVMLSEALVHSTYVKKLDLHRNEISNDGAKALSRVSNIEELDLSSNYIGDDGVTALSESGLQDLSISANPIGDAVRKFAASKSLKRLEASQCEITDRGAAKLFSSSSIEELDLSINRIFGDSLAYVVLNTILRRLNLSQNCLTSDSCRYLIDNKTIKQLILSSNYIGDDGAVLLARNNTMEEISLSQCSIGNVGACAFSKNTFLKKLFLFNNKITNDGALALAKNKFLLHLSLQLNPCNMSLLKKFYQSEVDGDFMRTEDFLARLSNSNNIPNTVDDLSDSPYTEAKHPITFSQPDHDDLLGEKENIKIKKAREKAREIIAPHEEYFRTAPAEVLKEVADYIINIRKNDVSNPRPRSTFKP